MPKSFTVFLLSGVLMTGVLSCNKTGRIELAVDFSSASSWKYLLGVDIKGTASSADSSQTFTSSARVCLEGKAVAHDKGAVHFRVKDTRVASDFLSDQELENLKCRFEGMDLSFSPNEGAVYFPDTTAVPVINIGGWDLFRSFAKVIPVLPGSKVAPGATWDRERRFPIETTEGSATGHLYQSFTFDSIITNGKSPDLAAISWLFSYNIELQPVDSGTVLETMPKSGNGRGDAQIDLVNKRLYKANAYFEAAPEEKSAIKMGWSESVHLEFIE